MIQFKNEHLTVFQSALYQTTSTVIEGRDFVLVVDPNWLPQEIEEIQQLVAQIRGEKELYLLFTHSDYDHVIGYHAFPHSKVIGSQVMKEHPDKKKIIEQICQFDNDYYINRTYPIEFPEIEIAVQKDQQQLVLRDVTLTFYLAPGHTIDGLFTVIEPMGIWLVGDYLSDFELPFIEYSAKAYGETLHKAELILANHQVSILIPGHGQITSSQAEMKRRQDMSKSYLERLILAVQADDSDALTALRKEMPFPSEFIRQCHEKNIEMVRREYKEFF